MKKIMLMGLIGLFCVESVSYPVSPAPDDNTKNDTILSPAPEASEAPEAPEDKKDLKSDNSHNDEKINQSAWFEYVSRAKNLAVAGCNNAGKAFAEAEKGWRQFNSTVARAGDFVYENFVPSLKTIHKAAVTGMIITALDLAINGTETTGRHLHKAISTSGDFGSKIASTLRLKTLLRKITVPRFLLAFWLMRMAYTSEIRKFQSEEYFQEGVADGVGTVLNEDIDSFSPADGAKVKTSDDVQKWMTDSKHIEALAKRVLPKLEGYDTLQVIAQLDKDIKTLGHWYVPCASTKQNLKRLFLGGKANLGMHIVHDFTKSEVEGSTWRLYNALDCRFGSAVYKKKMMKMILLKAALVLPVTKKN